MTDWRAIVESRLTGLRLSPARRRQVVQELSEHLEDEYAALCQQAPEDDALRGALSMLDDPETLIEGIVSAEEDPMTRAMRTLWIPGLVVASGYTLILVALPRLSGISVEVLFYGGLALLVMMGAAGSYWARSLGARPAQRALVSLAPVFVLLVSLLIALPVHAFKTGRPLFSPFENDWFALLRSLSIQSAALLLGALPFLKSSPRSSQPSP